MLSGNDVFVEELLEAKVEPKTHWKFSLFHEFNLNIKI